MKGTLRLLFTFSAVLVIAAGCHKRPAPVAEKKDSASVNEAARKGTAEKSDAEKVTLREEDKSVLKEIENRDSHTAAGASAAKGADVNVDLAAANPDYEAWFKKYHLDLNDPKMLDADPDGDGYTNREEFLAGTNPLDPNSHPDTHAGVHKSIRLKEYNEVQLPFILKSVDGESARIEHTDEGKGKVEEVHTGQTLRGSNYRVERIQARRGMDKEGNPVDASHVTLENPETKEKITLVKDLPTRTSNTYAVLTSANGKQTMTVRRGDTFNWPGEKNVTYKVLDLGSDQVVLQEVENGKVWTVDKR